jgi:hypothetical protein
LGVYRKSSAGLTQAKSFSIGALVTAITQGKHLLRAGLILLLGAAWLSMPLFPVQGEVPLEVLVVDTSASSRIGVGDADAWLASVAGAWLDDVRDRQGLGGPDADLMVVTFGPSASVLAGPSPGSVVPATLQRFLAKGPLAPRSSGGEHQASPLDAALALAEGAFEGHKSMRLTLVGDGSYSGADPAPRLLAWAARSIYLDIEQPVRDRADLAIGHLLAPPRVFAGAPIGIGLDAFHLMRAAAPGAPALRIQATFAGLSAQWFEPLSAAAESQHVQLDLATPFLDAMSAGSRGEVQFEIDAGYLVGGMFQADDFRANDQLTGAVNVGDAARVLVAADQDQIERARSFFLGAQVDRTDAERGIANGLAYRFLTPDQVPGELAGADALISFDLSPDDLPADRLRSFVESGGGWFAMGGWGLLADRNVHIGPGPRSLLPLGLDEDAPLRDVILAVDGSGSMQGEPFEVVRRGALELVNAAPATDEVRLVFFTNGLGVESRIRPAFAGDANDTLSGAEIMRRAKEAEADLAVLMSTQVPGGNTYVVGAMRELVSLREGSGRDALVLLLTDGQETRLRKNDDTEPESQRIGASNVALELIQERARLVVIGVGAMEDGGDPDLFLKALLQPGESVVRCGLEDGDEHVLGELLRQEVNRERIWEGGFGVARLGTPGSFELQLLPDIDGQELPGIARMGRYSLKPNAMLLAAAGGTKPLLAATRRQRGRTAALATLPMSPWAPDWLDAGNLEALLTWIADRPRERGPKVMVESGGSGDARIVLDGMGGMGGMGGTGAEPPVSGYDLEIRVTSLGQRGRFAPRLGAAPLAKVRASLLAGAPGWAGQRHGAALPARAADALAAGASLEVQVLNPRPETGAPVLFTLALKAPDGAGEGAPERPRLRLGNLAGTAQNRNPMATLTPPRPSPPGRPHPLAAWALGAGLALVFLGGLKAFGPTGR